MSASASELVAMYGRFLAAGMTEEQAAAAGMAHRQRKTAANEDVLSEKAVGAVAAFVSQAGITLAEGLTIIREELERRGRESSGPLAITAKALCQQYGFDPAKLARPGESGADYRKRLATVRR